MKQHAYALTMVEVLFSMQLSSLMGHRGKLCRILETRFDSDLVAGDRIWQHDMSYAQAS
jgi:hypothetical protein